MVFLTDCNGEENKSLPQWFIPWLRQQIIRSNIICDNNDILPKRRTYFLIQHHTKTYRILNNYASYIKQCAKYDPKISNFITVIYNKCHDLYTDMVELVITCPINTPVTKKDHAVIQAFYTELEKAKVNFGHP